MMRAIVLILCLASAGGIAAYTLKSSGAPGEPVYTVPGRAAAPLVPPVPVPAERNRIAPEDRAALARELQRELKRVGCYGGEVSGVWTGSSRAAMKAFVERVNAALPVDQPDPVLLSLVQGHHQRACTTAGRETQPDARADGPATSDTARAAAITAGAAGAAAAIAVTAPAAAARADAKAPAAETVRPAAKQSATLYSEGAPDRAQERAPAAAPERAAERTKPAQQRRPQRTTQTQQTPKVVRDVMKALGIK